MIRRLSKTFGFIVENIAGQNRLVYAISDTTDFYSLIDFSECGRCYYGSTIIFFDLSNGTVHEPFTQEKNVLYSAPIYADGLYYFLQGNYDEKKIVLYAYHPEKPLREVIELNLNEVDLYNLRLISDPVHIISQNGNKFVCYYPEELSLALDPHETVVLMSEGKIYIESWIEEGWDEKNHCATNKYKYYDKLIVKDYVGNTLSEEIGSLHQMQDGTWWVF